MTAKIATALHEVMSKVAYVQKTGKNAFHGYKYAGEADLLAVLRPAMVEAGLMLLPSVKSVSPVDEYGNVSVLMEYSLVHRDGEVWPEKIGAAGMGNDKAKNGSVGDKGVYKAITGANKYVLFKLFQIETGDDPEASEHHDVPAETKRQVGWSKDGTTRTAHSLKKEKVWEDFQMELIECETPSMVTKLALAWSKKVEEDKWPDSWKTVLREEMEKRMALLKSRPVPDDDTFPGDLPSNSKIISTLQAG